jgi:hypothetical protein
MIDVLSFRFLLESRTFWRKIILPVGVQTLVNLVRNCDKSVSSRISCIPFRWMQMDGLIVELNHSSCYDMIEQFCDEIQKQLGSLQKHR